MKVEYSGTSGDFVFRIYPQPETIGEAMSLAQDIERYVSYKYDILRALDTGLDCARQIAHPDEVKDIQEVLGKII